VAAQAGTILAAKRSPATGKIPYMCVRRAVADEKWRVAGYSPLRHKRNGRVPATRAV